MSQFNLSQINEMEIKLQEIEDLIAHLHPTKLQYDYLQKVTSIRKQLIHALLSQAHGRIPTTLFTLTQLQQNYNGKNNQPAYVAVDDIVYDITYEGAWAGGTHFGLQAGEDMSSALASCHSQDKARILSKLVPVGTLQSEVM